jgi:FAD/FMN-containing dehydrogenase
MAEDRASTSSLSPSLPFSIIWRSSAPTAVYEAARVGRIFNLRRPDRYPQAIVFATEVADILVAMQLAQKHSLKVAIRSGGHSWAAWSLLDNSILLDLGGMKHLELDTETLIASVSPSTTGLMLQRFLEPKGLWFPGGHCPDVALGGFLLVGGMGWNCKVGKNSSAFNHFQQTSS